VHTIGPSELFLGQIFFFCENQFSLETCTIGTSFWGNPRSNSPWKQAILEIGLTLFLGSDSCPPDAHTNTHDNHSYLVRDSVTCANWKCVLQLRCFWMRRTRFKNHSKQMVRGLNTNCNSMFQSYIESIDQSPESQKENSSNIDRGIPSRWQIKETWCWL
jgi:hypothetical protein